MKDDQLSGARWMVLAFLLALLAGMFMLARASASDDTATAARRTAAGITRAANYDHAYFIADPMFARWYKYAVNRDSERAAVAVTMIETAAKRAGVDDYGKMVAVAWYESRFKPDAKSKSGYYRGMFQLGRHFKKPMADMGLDYYNEADRLYFGMLKFKNAGLRPWSVRSRARRDYERVMRSIK